MNFRDDKVRTTVGIPGTGLSYAEQEKRGAGGALLLVAIIMLALLAAFWVFG